MTEAREPTFGRRLRHHRLRRSLTQQWLGAPRYTGAYISSIESGARGASASARMFLAGKLEKGLDELDPLTAVEVVDELELRLQQARRCISNGRLAEAEEALEPVVSRAAETKIARIVSSGHCGLAQVAYRKGRSQAAIAHVEQALESVTDHPVTTWVAPLCLRAQFMRLRGNSSEAAGSLEDLVATLREQDLAIPNPLARIYGLLAAAYMDMGREVDAVNAVHETRALDLDHIDDETLACMYLNISGPLRELADGAEARRCLLQAERIFRHLQLREEVAAVKHNSGWAMSASGDWRGARKAWIASKSMFGKARSGRNEIIALVSLAYAEEALGDISTARRYLRSALSKAQTYAPRFSAVAEAHELLARIAADEIDEALAHMDEAVSIYGSGGNRTATARVLRAKGMLLEKHRRSEEATSCYRDALAIVSQSPEGEG